MNARLAWLWRFVLLLLYFTLTCYQLGLPGLHYDEAKEAGVNAVELLSGAPVTAFRSATLSVAGYHLPLMVQDYIGALNVYLALPLLKLTGIGVPNLRFLAVLTGLATLLLLEKLVNEWLRYQNKRVEGSDTEKDSGNSQLSTRNSPSPPPLSPLTPGLLAITLLAVSPSFVFWSRQGIFVTNLTQPLVLLALWQGLVWLHSGRTRALLISAFAAGLSLYAKLLAFWMIVPFVFLVIIAWLRQWNQTRGIWYPARKKDSDSQFTIRNSQFIPAFFLFLLALSPFLLFNWQTGGTLRSVGNNLTQSYYGVNNLDIGANLLVRLQQIVQVFRGDQFGYLGGSFANWVAPRLAGILILVGLFQNWRLMLTPIVLTMLAFFASLFTVSGLFITHYALLQPVLIGLVALGTWAVISRNPQSAIRNPQFILLFLFFSFDLTNSLRYHFALARSGGVGDHSDASYHLAYHLRYNGLGAPVALDWGMDANVRFLSEGTVRPIELFGYDSISEPNSEFTNRLAPFLENPENTYLLHSADRTVFAGRREAFLAMVAEEGLQAVMEKSFAQRDGEVLFEIWRVRDP